MERYVAVQEPTCTWAVFDSFGDVPAEFEGRVLVGLEKAEAMLLASAANARMSPPEDRRDVNDMVREIRTALNDDVREDTPRDTRELPLDDKRRGAEKTATRTWRNW